MSMNAVSVWNGFNWLQVASNGFQVASNGFQMAFKWLSNGFQMAFKWLSNGFQMGSVRGDLADSCGKMDSFG
jgi:hypothetical protein